MRRIITGLALSALVLTAVAAPVAAGSASHGRPNIVQRLIQLNGHGRFDTLIAAATCPELDGAIVDALDGPQKRTLFAPTDAAFLDLELTPANVCSAFPTETLAFILSYHVYDAKVSYSQARSLRGQSITMLNGELAELTGTKMRLFIDGGRVLIPNIAASNGLIHVINEVMVPPVL